ncbi:hypothetical protein [Shewanella maritima]|uniref:hypothetical protein n=1 Tax=Shewanella maritima TaxID=2520507 RepID=UPI003735CF83
MGSSSKSNSSQATENNSISQGVDGDNNGIILNGNGNTITDGGAFDIIKNIVDVFLPEFTTQGANMVAGGFNAVTDVAQMGENQTEQAFNTALDLYGEANDAQQHMLEVGQQVLTESGRNQLRATEESFNFGRDALVMAGGAMDSAVLANERVTLAAMDSNTDLTSLIAGALQNANNNNTDLAQFSMENNTNFADRALDSAANASKDATAQLVEGYDMMLNNMKDFSRSDGVALAESSNKTMLMLIGGLALSGVIIAVIVTKGNK